MSSNTTIEVSYGMKYDFSNLIKSCLIESYTEYKKKQLEVRNFLIKQNKSEKKKTKRQEVNLFVIHDLKIKHKKECILDLSDEKFIPRGYFCYPIKGAYFQKSSFEMPYFPLLPFNEFKEAINTFSTQSSLSDSYLAYPCLPEKDYERIKNIIIKKSYNLNEENPLINNINTDNTKADNLIIRPVHCTSNINKYFIAWTFIKIIRGQMVIMEEDFKKLYSRDKNKIIIPILTEMSKYVNIEVNILYHIITTFLKQYTKNLSKNALSKKGITYKKYEKYWCRICNRFFCPFHFKIKVKCKTLNNGDIRTTYEYFKKIQITLRPPEYYIKEEEENKKNKIALEHSIKEIISNCDCCNNNENLFLGKNDNFKFDESLRFTKMAKITNKEDFFVLCKIVKTCCKFLNENSGVVYNSISKNYNINISKFLSPCVLRRVFNNKYDCNLIRYLIRLITDDKYLKDINLFLKALSGVSYENISEENVLFFNNSFETNLPQQKITDKGEKKIIKMPRTKTTARLQTSSKENIYYKPCDHYPDECTPENCACAKLGMCLRYCCCFKENDLGSKKNNGCQYMFLGCQHTQPKSGFRCVSCNCSNNRVECVPGVCGCGEQCRNNNITLGKSKKLIYGFSHKIKGGGLFAGENIKEGEFIDVYEGEMVEKDELDRLSVFYDQIGNNYPFNINNKYDYVSIKCGGLTRYINHGSFGEENVNADKVMVNGFPYIAFSASRNIKKFEELFYNYAYDKNSMPEWMLEYNRRMEMRSNSKNNRKQINKKKGNLIKSKDKKGEANQKLYKSINLDEDLD